ncbi:MAG: hypothetical protein KC713_01520 [Candidatus Omnitrophica bacterium]|nr:hypothetical protein [Candidatus Omnitrophota bacterium]
MSQTKNNTAYKTFVLSVLGFFIHVIGVTCILLWWGDVVRLIKGGAGIILAVSGLLVIYAVNKVQKT